MDTIDYYYTDNDDNDDKDNDRNNNDPCLGNNWCSFLFIFVAKIFCFFKNIFVLEKRKEWHYEAISLVTFSLNGYVWIYPDPRGMTLQPSLKYVVNHAMMIDEYWIIWGGSHISHDPLHVTGKVGFEITNTNNNVNLYDHDKIR